MSSLIVVVPVSESGSAGQVVNFGKPLLSQDAGCDVTTNADATTDHSFLCGIKFMQAVTQFIHGHMNRVFGSHERSTLDLPSRPNVNDLFLRQVGFDRYVTRETVEGIAGRERGLMDRVLG